LKVTIGGVSFQPEVIQKTGINFTINAQKPLILIADCLWLVRDSVTLLIIMIICHRC